MKLDEILTERSRDDAWWVDDALDSAWENDYTMFYEEIQGMVEELADMYPDQPKAKAAQKYFMKQFAGLEDAKIADNEYSEKFIHYVLGTDYGSDEMPFKEAIKRLREFEAWVDKVDIYYEPSDIEDREYDEGRFDYKGPNDPYADRGVKRSDF